MDNCEEWNLNISLHCVNYYKNDDKALEFFKSHGIIPNSVICPTCSNNCQFSPANNEWFCKKTGKDNRGRKRKCNFYVSNYKGTFLETCRINPGKLLLLIKLFCRNYYTHRQLMKYFGVKSEAINDWKNYLYEVVEN